MAFRMKGIPIGIMRGKHGVKTNPITKYTGRTSAGYSTGMTLDEVLSELDWQQKQKKLRKYRSHHYTDGSPKPKIYSEQQRKALRQLEMGTRNKRVKAAGIVKLPTLKFLENKDDDE